MNLEQLLSFIINESEKSKIDALKVVLASEFDQLKTHLESIPNTSIRYVTKDDACEMLKISKPTLDKAVKKSGIQYQRLFGCRRCYLKISDIEKIVRGV